ncbi:hypothetical protein DZJ_37280 [Dickeya ananatis]
MNVVILDTGCANLSSVMYAVKRLGYEPQVSREPEVVLRADKLFLPGVGTAQAAMDQLAERQLIALIKACSQPVLGICLGMQLLGSRSDETGGIDTLGIIDTPRGADGGPWSAFTAYGLESGDIAGWPPPVPRYSRWLVLLFCTQLRHAGLRQYHCPITLWRCLHRSSTEG